MSVWVMAPGVDPDDLGFLPLIIQGDDPRPFKEQLADRYSHGGGYSPFGEGLWHLDADQTLHYPDDPPFKPLAWTALPSTDEVVIYYQHAMVACLQKDGSFVVVRMD